MSQERHPEARRGEYELRRNETLATEPCEGCGAPMLWTVGEKGGPMPLSARTARRVRCPACRPNELEPVSGAVPVRCARCGSEGTVFLVLNHWATCPNRERFTSKRRPR